MSLSSHPSNRDWAAAAFLLLLLAFAVYQKALWFVPAEADDLRILSSVSQRSNPLAYFATDWGMENTYRIGNGNLDTTRKSYRPLHSISIWLGYRLFGVSAFPNQLLNLLLHILNVLILLNILRRLRVDIVWALLLAALGLVSLYTVSPAIWVSDRETLMVGFAVVVLLDHLVDAEGRLRSSLNPWLVVGLTVLAVCFKESGLIIPLMAGAFIALFPYTGPRWRHLAVCVVLVASYVALRVFLFGSNAFAYAAEGYIFGNQPYALLSDLPWQLRLWARFENVAKNVLCVFLPIIGPMGRLDSFSELISTVIWWLPTVVLAVAASQRPLTRFQWLVLTTIAINSVLHTQVYRYRVEYIPQLMLCLYVAASPIWQTRRESAGVIGRRRVAGVCCGILAFVSISQVNHAVHSNWIARQDELATRHLASVLRDYPISGRIVQQVLTRYGPRVDTPPSKEQ